MSAKNKREALSLPWNSMTPSILVCPVKLQLLLRLESFWLFLFLRQKMDSLSWVSEITVGDFMYSSSKKIHLLDTVVTGSAKTLNNILFSVWEWQLSLHSARSVLLLEADIYTMRACSVVLLVTLCDPIDCSLPALCLWKFPGKNTGVGCHFLLQGIFPTQGLNLSPVSPTSTGRFFTTEPPGKPPDIYRAVRPGFNPWVGKNPWRRAWQPTPIFLPGESPWTEESSRLQSMGSQRVRHSWVTKHIIC